MCFNSASRFTLIIVLSVFFQSGCLQARDSSPDFPEVNELPVIKQLPNPFVKTDGTSIQSKEDWPEQREYLKSLLTHYLYGTAPTRPDISKIKLQQLHRAPIFDETGLEEHYSITLSHAGREVVCRMWLVRPSSPPPFPTVVKNCFASFHASESSPNSEKATADRDWEAAEMAVRRGYLLCKFQRWDFVMDTPAPSETQLGVQALYPEHTWGAVRTWAWGQSVVLDVLENIGYTDMDKTIATGHSRGGQTAMAAGIYDERFQIVAPSTGSFGTCGTLRVRDPLGVRGKVDVIEAVTAKSFPHWYTDRYLEFVGKQNQMPFDGHTKLALIAPRPFLNTNATEDQYNNPLAMETGLRAGKLVYDWMEAGDVCRIHWRQGKHAQQEEDWKALFDFSDEIFFGKTGASRFNQWRYPDHRPQVSWQIP